MKLIDIFHTHAHTPDTVAEAWSKSYKKSINCSNPKGFSQRAHCAGRKKRQAHGKTKSKSISEQIQTTGLPYDILKFQVKPGVFHSIVVWDDGSPDRRAFIVLKINGVYIPFYISSGGGGKVRVPVGKWYPIFGVGPNGWLNKGSEDEIIKYYGSSDLKRAATQLDSLIGDLRPQYDNFPNVGYSTIARVANKDLKPVTGGKGSESPYNNINQTLIRMGSMPLLRPVIENLIDKLNDKVISKAEFDKDLQTVFQRFPDKKDSIINFLQKHGINVNDISESYNLLTHRMKVEETIEDYDAWIRYTPDSLHADWEEYVHKQDVKWHKRADMIGARWPLFTSMQQFKQALDAAPIVNVDELSDVENLTKNHSLADIERMVGGYQNPRDVSRIQAGLHAGVSLPLPIILKGDSGMWIQAGNTRQATARVMGVTPKALLVDVSA
jgi:hypothetical protein